MARKLIAKIIGITALIVLAVVLLVYLTSPKYYRVLVVGSDQRGTERARSDVLFVVSVPKSGDESPLFLSIPRDTKIEHEEYGLEKINHLYGYGERPDDDKLLGNIDATQGAVEDLLGVKMDATVEVTFASFAEIVDVVGGAVVSGESGGGTFDGVNTSALRGEVLTGEDALVLIRDRFTGDRTDFDRQADAREIMRSMITKVKDPDVVRSVLDYFDTAEYARLDFNKRRLGHFLIGAGIARKGQVSIGEMVEESIPGEGGRVYTPDFGKELYYWIVNEEELQALVEEHLK